MGKCGCSRHYPSESTVCGRHHPCRLSGRTHPAARPSSRMQQILCTLAVPLRQHLSVNSPNQGLDFLALDCVRTSVLPIPSTWDTDSVCNWSVSIVNDHLWIQKYFSPLVLIRDFEVPCCMDTLTYCKGSILQNLSISASA